METTQMHTVNLCTILSNTKRILKANYNHFVALSLFFLPLAFSLVITPILYLSGNFFTVDDLFHKFLANNQKVVIFHLLYILIVYLLAICAIGTISYSTYHHVFIGKPVNYLAAVKSLTSSFFPLVYTSILAHVLLFSISLTLLLFVGVIIKSLRFIIDHNSIFVMWFVGASLFVLIIYFLMNWCLALIIVVAESKSGVPALMRSWYLVKGMRSVSLSLLLYYLIGNGVLAWVSSMTVMGSDRHSGLCGDLLFTMLGSFFLMACLLASTVANAVLYMYCKAFHGELATDIGEGFDYVNLTSDDDKITNVVTVAEA